MASLRGDRTLSELASAYGVHPVQIAQWKKRALTALPQAFLAWELSVTLDGPFCRDALDRALDNVFVERLWRSVKYEEVYLKDYASVREAQAGLSRYFAFYNQERSHQALGYRTPAEVYGAVPARALAGSRRGR